MAIQIPSKVSTGDMTRVLCTHNPLAKEVFGLTDRERVIDYPQRSASMGMQPRSVGSPSSTHSGPEYAQMTIHVHNARRNAVNVRLFQ